MENIILFKKIILYLIYLAYSLFVWVPLLVNRFFDGCFYYIIWKI